MHLRKVSLFGTILGVTLPKSLTNALDLKWKDYVEVFLSDSRTLIIKKHEVPTQQITTADGKPPESVSTEYEQ